MQAKTQLTTTEVARISGATKRQLQWWDEQGYLRPTRGMGKRRWYTREQADCAKVWVKLRKRYRFRFKSKIAAAIQAHDGEIVVLQSGHCKIVSDTLVIAV